MSGRRFLFGAFLTLAVVGVALGPGGPSGAAAPSAVRAQSDAGSSPVTTVPGAPAEGATGTDPVSPPATAPGGGPADGPAPGPDSEMPTTTVDPLVGEAPGEEVPDVDATVPAPAPDGAYAGQKPYQPPPVLWSSVRQAEKKLAEARAAEQDQLARVASARATLKALDLHRQKLDVRSDVVDGEIDEATEHLRDRAVAAFISNDQTAPAMLGALGRTDYDKVLDLEVRDHLVGAVIDADQDELAGEVQLRTAIDRSLAAVADDLVAAEATVAAAEAEAEAAAEAVRQAEAELAAFEAGSAVYISGVVFPVAEPYSRPLIDSYGFPRMPGTPDEHWHEGIDIFAPAGTPLLAAERGVITRVGTSRLGGLTLWLRGESGADWYYAHLQSHAPDLVEGMVVEPGQVVGFVGNTGNALATPPHLHLQLHPNGGDPVNPYPLLAAVAAQGAPADGSR